MPTNKRIAHSAPSHQPLEDVTPVYQRAPDGQEPDVNRCICGKAWPKRIAASDLPTGCIHVMLDAK